ncbi:protein of unknown function DUF6651 [Erwinia phage Gungnir39]|nr:protein of unknown function DUF6651 [Erwinia phage Gungnir39]
MKLKTVEVNGKHYAEIDAQGMPIYTHEDGNDIPFDAAGTVATITRLNGEAKQHREGKQAAEQKLRAYAGITDPEAALRALETMSKVDQKKLIDAGEVDRVRDEIGKAFQSQLSEANERTAALESQLYSEKIGGSFARSKFISERLAIPADMVQASFGKNFKVEDGNIVPYDSHGNKIYSRTRPGEVADFDEGLELIVDNYAYKENIMKAQQQSGGGSQATPGKPGALNRGNMAGEKSDRVAALKAKFPELG